jgi:hypothetical protein
MLEEIPLPQDWPVGTDSELVRSYIQRHPDYRSYHLLFALKERDNAAYAAVSSDTKARVLASSLQHLLAFNDWILMGARRKVESVPSEALQACGIDAIPHLMPLLNGHRRAVWYGSEDATIAHIYGYRVSDYAYFHIARAIGTEPEFPVDVSERDKLIQQLRVKVRQLDD